MKFESNSRQIDRIMEECYKLIGKPRSFVKVNYNDDIHIALDLLNEYRRIAKELLESKSIFLYSKNERMNITYIADSQYSNPHGGILDVNLAIEIVRDKLQKILKKNKRLQKEYLKFESVFNKMEIISYPTIGSTSIKVEVKEIELEGEIVEYKRYHDYIYLKCKNSYLIDKYGNLIKINLQVKSEKDIVLILKMNHYTNPFIDGEKIYNNLLKGLTLPNNIDNQMIQKYICLRIIFDLSTRRNISDDLERLVDFTLKYTTLDYKKIIYKMIVGNWYVVFPYKGNDEQKLTIKRLRNLNAFDGSNIDGF